jgi:hypothetical protein
MNRISPRCLSLFLLLLVSILISLAQNPATTKGASVVSGRITLGDQPAQGVAETANTLVELNPCQRVFGNAPLSAK